MSDLFVVYNMQSTYCDFGTHEFKIVLNPKLFKHGRDAEIVMRDPDGRDVSIHVEKWGRKLNCSFDLNPDFPDGVAVVELKLQDDRSRKHKERLTFWVVKP